MREWTRERAAVSVIARRLAFIGTGTVGILVLSSAVTGTAFATTHHPTNKQVNKNVAKMVIATVKNASLGTILVGQKKTVYVLSPTRVNCDAACLRVWPAVTIAKGVARAQTGAGVQASRLGTVVRAGGVRQVTYEGRALYWFSGDTSVGELNGNGLKDQWGRWSVFVTVKAKKRPPVKGAASSHPTTTASSSYYGY